MPKRVGAILLLPLTMFMAGFGSLIFEVSWFRMLSLVVGATVSASTLVLVAFMGGFGIGAWYWGNHSAKNNNPGRLLTLLFASIAVFGLLSIWFINHLLPSCYTFLPSAGLSEGFTRVAVFTLAVLLLFIPAFFMGGVLPLIAGCYIKTANQLQSGMGNIYAFETIGSTLGGLITGFWLVGFTGQSATVLVAVVINTILAIIFLVLKPIVIPTAAEPASIEKITLRKTKTKQPQADIHPIDLQFIALLAAFISGFSVIGLQVVWFRIFRIYMTNSGYTFSLIASMVILGLFAGSWLYSLRGSKITNPAKVLLRLTWLMAIASALGLVILVNLPVLVMFPFESMHDTHAIRILLIPFLSALLVIVPVTMTSGFLFPLACTTHTKNYATIGNSIGKVLLINTAGSVTGPLLAAFVLIPLAGAGRAVLLFAATLLISSFFIMRSMNLQKKTATMITGVLALVSLVIAILLPQVKILPPSFSRFPKEILAYNESTEGTFVVGQENKQGTRVLSTYVNNSAVIGSTYDAIKVVKMVGHLPFFAGLKCNNVLVVGFGIGVTTSAVASHPEVKHIDCVELVAGLKGAAHYYSDLNHGIERDPRLSVRSGDGRHFLQSTTETFDLITTDPTHPILGSASLYTREYFELCRSHLNKGGMVSQYLPLHKLLPGDFKGIIQTFCSVFPKCTIWLGHYHAVLLGFTGDGKIDFREWANRMAAMQPDIWFYNNPYALASSLVLDATEIDKFGVQQHILTDDLPYTEYCSLSSFDAANLPANLSFMNNSRESLNRVFYNIPDPALMQHYVEGNRLMTDALRLMLQGDRNGFMMKMQEATMMNPDNQEFPFMMKLNMK